MPPALDTPQGAAELAEPLLPPRGCTTSVTPQSLGAPSRLVQLVAHHSGAAYEAEQRGLSPQLAAYDREDSPLLDALSYADMKEGNEAHTTITKARPYLDAAVARTERGMKVFHSVPPSRRTVIDRSGWWPPESFAVEHQDVELLACFLDAGADPNSVSLTNGLPLLMHAIDMEGDGALQTSGPLTVATTAVLLAYGADPEHGTPDGDAPLSLAEYYNHGPAIRLLRRHIQRGSPST
ncbi:hypothetical protein ACFWZ2_05300 [Streptomyces sp. NPDC059002]|uniref:hypothetical protein n=1 Tax=Streptomyces sp. NPDC059002 TaxID=3346690 RepID=UPI00369085C3